MADSHAYFTVGLESPFTHAAPIAPSDTTDVPDVPRNIWVGIEGDLTVTMLGGGAPVTLRGVAGGLPLRVTRVWATGTTAGEIVGLW